MAQHAHDIGSADNITVMIILLLKPPGSNLLSFATFVDDSGDSYSDESKSFRDSKQDVPKRVTSNSGDFWKDGRSSSKYSGSSVSLKQSVFKAGEAQAVDSPTRLAREIQSAMGEFSPEAAQSKRTESNIQPPLVIKPSGSSTQSITDSVGAAGDNPSASSSHPKKQIKNADDDLMNFLLDDSNF